MTAWLTSLLGRLHPDLKSLSTVPLLVLVGVFFLTAAYTLWTLYRGGRIWWQLSVTIRRIRKLTKANKKVKVADVTEVMQSEPLRHLWDEYRDTLHDLQKASNGGVALIETRATVPAEVYFTRDVLVDGRMFDDFFRHLPGVMTGLGIIGTFAGLLNGLQAFDPSNTATAVAGLKPLLAGVEHAFIASAVAIGCAMYVVFTSRLALAYLYRLVEGLNQAIDALYNTGAGEEYLARLVKASEKSEAHAGQLKDALVEELRTLLTNLTERQIEAQVSSSQALGDRVSDSIRASLEAPMQRMSEAMEQTTKGNGEQVSGMLETVLTGFMAKLEDTFGGQMRGINDQMQRSMDAMTSVQSSLQSLLADIARTNEQASNQMSGRLEEAMAQAAANQELMTNQMREFVKDFRRLVSEEQDKSKRVMDDAIGAVLTQVRDAVAQLEQVRQVAATQEQARNEGLTSRTEQVVSGLSDGVEALLKQVSEQVTQSQANIRAIEGVSLRAIDGMNQGALTMGTAAQRFETAGGAVTTVFDKSTKVAEQLTTTASTLQTAAAAVRDGFQQYDTTRLTVDKNVALLTGLVEQAKREAGVTKELIADLERVAQQIRAAEQQSTQYLEGVNKALVTAFQDFGTALTNQLQSTIGQTDRHLGNGVQQLNGVVQEIGAALSRMKRAA